MRRFLSLFAACALFGAGPARANDQAQMDALFAKGDAVARCYRKQAEVYGAKTCQRPDIVLGVVYAACGDEEMAVSSLWAEQGHHSPGSDRVTDLRTHLAGSIQKTILDLQIARHCP